MNTETRAALALWRDAGAAERDGRLSQADLPDDLEPAAAADQLRQLLAARGLLGYDADRRAEVGVPDHCPPWCAAGHDPVVLLMPGTDEGRDHHGEAVDIGPARVFRSWSTDDATECVTVEYGSGFETSSVTLTPDAADHLAAALVAAAVHVRG